MATYKETESLQSLFLQINLADQILPGTFEWTMNHFIDGDVDLTKFDTNYNNDETGAPAIHPRIMLKIILYGYSLGQLSSRNI